MNKKNEQAFTLAELLAVITILGVIALIVFPAVNKAIKNSKEKSYNQQVESILNSAENWTLENMSSLSDTNDNYITIGELKQSGYLEAKRVINPITDEEMNGCIVIKYDTNYNQYTYRYEETNCDELEPKGLTFKEVMEPLIGTEVNNNDPDGNLRYVGANPNNYVSFNGELWRIIGVFNGQAKIIRNEYYSTSTTWDASVNNWAEADLQETLNGTYLSSIQTNDMASYNYIDLNHVWNLGAYDSSFTTTGTRSAFYRAERSETKSSAMTSHQWTGAIGLMYPSDYGYASSGSTEICEGKEMNNWYTGDYKTECAENSWIYDSAYVQWTLTPHGDYSSDVSYVDNTGYVGYICVYNDFAARPVLFLKSDTKIVGGQGTFDQPFELGA